MHAPNEVGVHYLDADLSMAEPWEELADEEILVGLEALLGKYAAFHAYLLETGQL